MRKGYTAFELVVIIAVVTTAVGYTMNATKLFNLDFEAPYKAEIIRSAGLFIPPVGVIAGYISIDD